MKSRAVGAIFPNVYIVRFRVLIMGKEKLMPRMPSLLSRMPAFMELEKLEASHNDALLALLPKGLRTESIPVKLAFWQSLKERITPSFGVLIPTRPRFVAYAHEHGKPVPGETETGFGYAEVFLNLSDLHLRRMSKKHRTELQGIADKFGVDFSFYKAVRQIRVRVSVPEDEIKESQRISRQTTVSVMPGVIIGIKGPGNFLSPSHPAVRNLAQAVTEMYILRLPAAKGK
ncbi:MAG: hypothetical protein V1881_01635 [Candidatus Micrarchaeota archaeon]